MATGNLRSRVPSPLHWVADGAFQARVLAESGILRPIRPDKLARIAAKFVRWGTSPATGVAAMAITNPDDVAIIDERGELTYQELHERSNALAHAFAELGIGPDDGVGIMARNHRGFIEATLAAAKVGASSLYLNTMFAGPQLAEVMEREGPKLLVHDEEFTELLEGVNADVKRVIAWVDGEPDGDTLDGLIEGGDTSELSPPPETPRFVILTSGTTGTPKGAQRSSANGLGGLASMISKIPFRSRERFMIACPLFHSWGFTHFILALPLGATVVLRRKFSEEGTLQAVEEHGAHVLAVVPVMMQRTLNLDEDTLSRYKLPTLRITSVSGSALPGELATKWMDHFGDNVYNLYGSTEVAYATIATPEDLRSAPGTAGRPPRGTIVRLYDEEDNEVGAGETGRIFVGNDMAFEGYTGGGGKDTIEGLMSSGDVGHFDEEGRLFIDGRDDEMIVSGGENVFPREVEDLLSDHEAVVEAAVIGIEDEDFGQRLKAFVVLGDGKDASEDDLKKHVKSNLAGYKTPKEVEFLDELPRNATGKVLKRELEEKEAEKPGREVQSA